MDEHKEDQVLWKKIVGMGAAYASILLVLILMNAGKPSPYAEELAALSTESTTHEGHGETALIAPFEQTAIAAEVEPAAPQATEEQASVAAEVEPAAPQAAAAELEQAVQDQSAATAALEEKVEAIEQEIKEDIKTETPEIAVPLEEAGTPDEAKLEPAAEPTVTAAIQPEPAASTPTYAEFKDFLDNAAGKTNPLQTCQMENWGVQFSCDLTWEVLDRDPGNIRVTLSKEPFTTLSWKKFDNRIRFFEQLNRFFFEKLGYYQDDFQMEQVKFAGHDAVLVKGRAQEDPNIQMRDFYYLHGDKLVGVFFRVSPIEKWEEGTLVIKRVKDSFSQFP